ncbi:26S proteasome non-ATPase regulatory subunit 14 [Orchesella cincta]|uniref:26S proteasome non-ATPase regulatory subunit 14 n=1 Tax=Orchesella cincta TaxID=48709 RepID=A0A1D2MQQ6_ORCCI|nr:26S proteasome non-ATPase regulatory subunit 14 [Orchesella cincta]
MDRLLRLGAAMPGLGQGGPPADGPIVDTAEQVYISSLALLKMLKHGRAGVPMEVMGLMLGEFVDDYTVRVIDVFAMPQSGTGVSVEAVDPVFQAKMLDMLRQTGRPEMVVGWYHSHPGKVVIDAFRLINPNMMVLGQEPRQTTSNLGHLQKPSIQALIHGLNRHYYSISINYHYSDHCKMNESTLHSMLDLAKAYNKALEEEEKMTPEQLAIKNVGKRDPKRHLEEQVDQLMSANIIQNLGAMLHTIAFK